MLKKKLLIALICLAPALNAAGQDNRPDPDAMADKEVERLESTLKLEDWQVFYVDSTLRHNYAAMMAEVQTLQRTRVENVDLYVAIQDKWMEATEAAYKKFFTESQWKLYLKQGGQHIINDREKRRKKKK